MKANGCCSIKQVGDYWRSCAKAAQAEGERVLKLAGMERVTVAELIARCKVVTMGEIDGERRGGGSTWQSLERGRPLESAWLEGAIAALAAEIKCPAPINRFLAQVAANPRKLTAAEVLANGSGG